MAGNIISPSIQHSAMFFKAHPDAVIPARKSEEAAGFDLCTVVDFKLSPGDRVVVPTGLIVQPPGGFHTEIIVRSGLAYKYGIMLTNGVGLIDRDFAGEKDEIKIMLCRPFPIEFEEPVFFKKGDRIAQLLFRRTYVFEFEELSQPPGEVTRGGFGSTGIK